MADLTPLQKTPQNRIHEALDFGQQDSKCTKNPPAMKPTHFGLLTLVLLLGLHLALPAQEDWESGRFFYGLIHPADLRGYHQLELYDSASKNWGRRGR
jgi:hypothetical protein